MCFTMNRVIGPLKTRRKHRFSYLPSDTFRGKLQNQAGKGQSPAMLTARDLPFPPEGEGERLQDARILLG